MAAFNFKKKYGQNFLNDDNIIDKIVNSINPTSNDLIVEIGPGGGALTKKLQKYNANILAFEIDKDTSKYLDKIVNSKTRIIYEDFLKVDVQDYLKEYTYDFLFIVGNLPYYITTAILEKIIDSNIDANIVTIMVQKEVAARFLAKSHSKEYGYMTVLLHYFYDIKKITDVKRTCFYPIPNVDSAVVQLVKRVNKQKVGYQQFKSLLQESFKFKRKKLLNNITSIDKDILIKILDKNGFTNDARAEEIDFDTFVELALNKR